MARASSTLPSCMGRRMQPKPSADSVSPFLGMVLYSTSRSFNAGRGAPVHGYTAFAVPLVRKES